MVARYVGKGPLRTGVSSPLTVEWPTDSLEGDVAFMTVAISNNAFRNPNIVPNRCYCRGWFELVRWDGEPSGTEASLNSCGRVFLFWRFNDGRNTPATITFEQNDDCLITARIYTFRDASTRTPPFEAMEVAKYYWDGFKEPVFTDIPSAGPATGDGRLAVGFIVTAHGRHCDFIANHSELDDSSTFLEHPWRRTNHAAYIQTEPPYVNNTEYSRNTRIIRNHDLEHTPCAAIKLLLMPESDVTPSYGRLYTEAALDANMMVVAPASASVADMTYTCNAAIIIGGDLIVRAEMPVTAPVSINPSYTWVYTSAIQDWASFSPAGSPFVCMQNPWNSGSMQDGDVLYTELYEYDNSIGLRTYGTSIVGSSAGAVLGSPSITFGHHFGYRPNLDVFGDGVWSDTITELTFGLRTENKSTGDDYGFSAAIQVHAFVTAYVSNAWSEDFTTEGDTYNIQIRYYTGGDFPVYSSAAGDVLLDTTVISGHNFNIWRGTGGWASDFSIGYVLDPPSLDVWGVDVKAIMDNAITHANTEYGRSETAMYVRGVQCWVEPRDGNIDVEQKDVVVRYNGTSYGNVVYATASSNFYSEAYINADCSIIRAYVTTTASALVTASVSVTASGKVYELFGNLLVAPQFSGYFIVETTSLNTSDDPDPGDHPQIPLSDTIYSESYINANCSVVRANVTVSTSASGIATSAIAWPLSGTLFAETVFSTDMDVAVDVTLPNDTNEVRLFSRLYGGAAFDALYGMDVYENKRVWLKEQFLPGKTLGYENIANLVDFVFPDFKDSVEYISDKTGLIEAVSTVSGMPYLDVIALSTLSESILYAETTASLADIAASFDGKSIVKVEDAQIYFGVGLSANYTSFGPDYNPIKLGLQTVTEFTSASATNILVNQFGRVYYAYCTTMKADMFTIDTYGSLEDDYTYDVSGNMFEMYYSNITTSTAGSVYVRVNTNTAYNFVGVSANGSSAGLKLAERSDNKAYPKSGVVRGYNMGDNVWYITNIGGNLSGIHTALVRVTATSDVSSISIVAQNGSIASGCVRVISHTLGAKS